MFQKILCAVDGSKHALHAAEVASELAGKLGAKLTFVTVAKELKVTPEVRRYMELEHLIGSPQYVLDEMTEKIIEDAKDCAERCGARGVRTEVLTGPPARTIISLAERSEFDLVVLGSRGMGDVESALLGSVSHKVSQLVSCACLLVK